jgi:3-oxoacyl-[acyl-carrier-protein] synthase-3
MNRRAAIVGTGRFVADTVFTNEQVVELCQAAGSKEIYNPRLVEELRLRQRLGPEGSTATMCIEAGSKAIRSAGIKPEEIDLLICATDTPDYISPATAARVQHGVAATHAGFFDLNSTCAGFTYGLAVASNYLCCMDDARYALVVAGNAFTRYLDPADLYFNLFFADGAGAAVLARREGDDDFGIRKVVNKGFGHYWHYFGIYAGGTWKGFSAEAQAQGWHYLKNPTPYPMNINIKNYPPFISELLQKTGWTAADIDRAFFTQSRRENILSACKHFGWDPSVSYDTVDRYGYTGSSCVAVAIDDANEKGVLRPGEKILICTSGTGATNCLMTHVWGP